MLLCHGDTDEIIHIDEVLERQSSDMICIKLREYLVKGIVIAFHLFVELSDPGHELHSLVRLLLLELLSSLDHCLLELLEANRGIPTFVLLHLGQSINLILRQTRLQPLQTGGELLLVEAIGTGLGFRFAPLVEQSFVGQ